MNLQPVQNGIRTQGDLARYVRGITANAFATAFAYILTPMIRWNLLSATDPRSVAQQALANYERIIDNEITVEDIQELLKPEYRLALENSENKFFWLWRIGMILPARKAAPGRSQDDDTIKSPTHPR